MATFCLIGVHLDIPKGTNMVMVDQVIWAEERIFSGSKLEVLRRLRLHVTRWGAGYHYFLTVNQTHITASKGEFKLDTSEL